MIPVLRPLDEVIGGGASASVLATLFRLGRAAVAGHGGRAACEFSRIHACHWRALRAAFLRLIEVECPVMESPFEGTDRIAGGSWLARDVANYDGDGDGALVLRIEAGCVDDLPMHVHEHSDRMVILISGACYLHHEDDAGGVTSTSLRPGSIATFPRGLLHTFSTGDEAALLFSYHSLFIDLDDPRQYHVPKPARYPRRCT